jgi:NAD(P)-dependent dehydrogenase (short-subunit alcohol dehydrogenase family)
MSDSSPPVAVVTGATRGIGLEIAKWLAQTGWAVSICSRNSKEAVETSIDLAREFGQPTLGSEVDVGSVQDVEDFAKATARELGEPSLLVCNAAILGPVGEPDDCDPEAWSTALATNVGGSFNVIRAFWAGLKHIGCGRIVLMSGGGVGGPNPMKRASSYVASKAALALLVESLAYDLADTDCTINSIAPGSVPTTFMQNVLDVGVGIAGKELFDDAAGRSGDIPSGVLDEFFKLLGFLLSPESSHVSGRTLSVRWNRVDDLREMRFLPDEKNLFRLRRIDNQLFTSEG